MYLVSDLAMHSSKNSSLFFNQRKTTPLQRKFLLQSSNTVFKRHKLSNFKKVSRMDSVMVLLLLTITALHVPLLATALPAPPVPSPPPAGSLEWEARIVGSASYAGLLQVRRRGTSAWGTVCDDYFSHVAAVAACRSVGFAHATGAYHIVNSLQRSPGGSGSILLDNVRCSSGDTYLDNCTKEASMNCYHTEDVTINCFPDGAFDNPPPANASQWEYRQLTSRGSPFLQARPTAVSAWGYFCASGFGEAEAEVACRSMGYAGSVSPLAAANLFSAPPLYMRDTNCPASSTSTTAATIATSCTYDFATEFQRSAGICPGNSYLKLSCRPHRNAAAATAHNRGWEVRFAQESASVTSGLLQVRPNTSEPWGTVCDDFFDASAAAASCRSLGFAPVTTSDVAYRSATSSETIGYTSATIYMDNVRCSNSASTYLPNCSFLFSDGTTRRHNCGRSELIYLSCAGPISTSTPAPTTTTAAPRRGTSSGSRSGGAVHIILPAVIGGLVVVIAVGVTLTLIIRGRCVQGVGEGGGSVVNTSEPAVTVTDHVFSHSMNEINGRHNDAVYGNNASSGFGSGVDPCHPHSHPNHFAGSAMLGNPLDTYDLTAAAAGPSSTSDNSGWAASPWGGAPPPPHIPLPPPAPFNIGYGDAPPDASGRGGYAAQVHYYPHPAGL